MKKKKKYGRALNYEQRKVANESVVFYSPTATLAARDLAEIKGGKRKERNS